MYGIFTYICFNTDLMKKRAKRVQPERKKTSAKKPVAKKKAKSGLTEYEISHSPSTHTKEPLPEFGFSASPENKNQRLELRLTKLQKEVINKASSISGFKNVSDYILHIAITDSKSVIREQQIFELSERDRIAFMEALVNPPKPGTNLRKARANYLSFKKGR